ncbi:DUF1294 domain-containing protein [Sulfitobacter aquimarinus]|uniref:DUF1294 domain-containing protein n=1 Tax=Sulfitobacter aquimarinus TaxID=3158557 RepID=UPI003F70DAAE
MNLATYRQFASDKQAAIAKDQRTPEATLLWWAAIGGWAGAKYAQQKLRHKSSKEPFRSQLNLIGVKHAMTTATVVLVLGFLALWPAASPSTAPTLTAAQASAPAGAPPVISLRPPAAYRAAR